MSAIPGTQFNITGASGTNAFLGAKNSWRVYILPRGGYASQSSSGSTITFDSSAIASRFATGKWIQVGTDASKIRQVSGVGGNSITYSGTAVTVTVGDRVFFIGSTQPTVSGSSVTYLNPDTIIYPRDDDGSTRISNSMLTTDSNGMVQFFSLPAVYDALVQDGNISLQGSMIDFPVGLAEGISTSQASVFGATVTITANLIGDTVTVNKALGVTGWATFGATVTMNANAGVTGSLATGTITVGTTATINGNAGITGSITVGGSASFTSSASTCGVSGPAVFGGSVTITPFPLLIVKMADTGAGTYSSSGVSLGTEWGTGAITIASSIGTRMHGTVGVSSGNASLGANPQAVLTFPSAFISPGPDVVVSRTHSGDQPTIPIAVSAVGTTSVTFKFMGTPTANTTYAWTFIALSRTG